MLALVNRLEKTKKKKAHQAQLHRVHPGTVDRIYTPVCLHVGSTPLPCPLAGSRSRLPDLTICLLDRVACALIYHPIDPVHCHRSMGETRRGSRPLVRRCCHGSAIVKVR